MKKIINHAKIYCVDNENKEEIGYLQLIQTDNLPVYELEYWLDEEYHNKGIMSARLPIYLQELKEKSIIKLMALVEEGNEASIKLLKKNNFIELCEPKEGLKCFINNLN